MALGPQFLSTASVFVYLSPSGHVFNITWQVMIKTYSTSYQIRSHICVNFHRMPNCSKTQIWSGLIQHVFSLNPNMPAHQFSAG